MLKTVAAIAVGAVIPMLCVGSSPAIAQAQGAAETDRAPAQSATPSATSDNSEKAADRLWLHQYRRHRRLGYSQHQLGL